MCEGSPGIPALGKWRQKDQKPNSNLKYTVNSGQAWATLDIKPCLKRWRGRWGKKGRWVGKQQWAWKKKQGLTGEEERQGIEGRKEGGETGTRRRGEWRAGSLQFLLGSTLKPLHTGKLSLFGARTRLVHVASCYQSRYVKTSLSGCWFEAEIESLCNLFMKPYCLEVHWKGHTSCLWFLPRDLMFGQLVAAVCLVKYADGSLEWGAPEIAAWESDTELMRTKSSLWEYPHAASKCGERRTGRHWE